MPDARDVILKHIAAVNEHDNDAEPWAADAELVAPGGQASGRDGVLGFLGVFHEAFPDLRLEVEQLLQCARRMERTSCFRTIETAGWPQVATRCGGFSFEATVQYLRDSCRPPQKGRAQALHGAEWCPDRSPKTGQRLRHLKQVL